MRIMTCCSRVFGLGRGVSLALIAVMLLSGCIVHKVRLPKEQILLKVEKMSKASLLEKLKVRSAEVRTLIVDKMALKASQPISNETVNEIHSPLLSGVIVVDRTGRIHLEIDLALTTQAEMVSDGKRYKFSLPYRGSGQFGEADVSAPVLSDKFPYNMRPGQIIDALFVDGEKYIDDKEIKTVVRESTEEHPDGLHPLFRILFVRADIAIEELTFDRYVGQVTRKIHYREDGSIEADVRYSNYDKVDSIQFPKLIMINRPIENYTLEMKFEKLSLNKPVQDSQFTLERPEGSDDLDLTTGKVTKTK